MTDQPEEVAVSGLVTIDVEPDNVWADTHSRSIANIAQLPRFDKICRRYGIRPTYLVSWSVAEDKATAILLESLLRQGGCEIGVHPHLWETPPFVKQDAASTAWVGPQYADDVIEAKIDALVTLIATRFGAPKSHRAGRWGLDIRQIPMLQSRGIVVDSSVIPGIDWTATGIADYTNAPRHPYFMASDSLVRPGATGLLQVPCTIKAGAKLFGFERNRIISPMLQRAGLGPKWLRVSPNTTVETLVDLCSWAVDHLPHLNIMSHSSEFMAGGSPYWQSEADVSRHLAAYERLFSLWRDHRVKPMTLAEYAAIWKSNKRIGDEA